MIADLVIHNGKIVTMDKHESIAEAIAIKSEKIVFVGSIENANQYIGAGTEKIDVEGRTVLPGLIDSHAHFMDVGAARKIYIDLSEEAGIHSISDIQARLKERAEELPIGEWIFGYQEDDSKLLEKRHPTRWELDEVSKEHPILVTTVGGHFWMANSLALEQVGVTRETPDPVGGKFDRDQETGEPTGHLHEEAYNVLRPEGPPEPTREQAYAGAKEILQECTTVGLTCVYDLVDSPELQAALDLKDGDELPIRMRMDATMDLLETRTLTSLFQTEELVKKKETNHSSHNGLGDDWLRLCGVKFFFDGAISARTAAVSEPYLNKPDFYGVFATTEEIARKTLADAYAKGHRLSAHVNGDRAITLYLDILEELQKENPRDDPRNRAIHCTVVNPKIVERINELGVLPTIFGPYPYYHGDKLIPAFGEERLEWMFAARSFLDADVRIAAHSDHPCAPYPPLMAIHALVNRTTKTGNPIGQSQKVTVIDALRLYTTNAAYHQFDEDKLGSIEVGKLADCIVLSKDILTVEPEHIIDINVDMTIIGGRVVYQRL